MKSEIKIFEQSNIRSIYDEKKEKWYFSVVDLVAVLSNSTNPSNYWRVLKKRLIEEGNETITNCNGLKFPRSSDGKNDFFPFIL